MTPAKKAAILKAMRFWAASFVLVAGFLYYKSRATLGAVLIAGFCTFVITVGRAWMKRDKSALV